MRRVLIVAAVGLALAVALCAYADKYAGRSSASLAGTTEVEVRELATTAREYISAVVVHYSASVMSTVTVKVVYGTDTCTVQTIALDSEADDLWQPTSRIWLQGADSIRAVGNNAGVTGTVYCIMGKESR